MARQRKGQGNIVANDDEFNENDSNETNSSGKGLRAQLEAALSKIKTLEESNDSLSKRVRSTDLVELFKANKARVGAEKLYPKDAEVSEAAVKAWIEENKTFVLDEVEESDESNVSEETRTNAQRLGALSDVAVTRGNDVESIMEQIKSAKSSQELDAIYAQIGIRRE